MIDDSNKNDNSICRSTFPVETNRVTELTRKESKMHKQVRVLVVDDEPRICRLILDVLVQEGYMVEVSFSGADALQLISKYNYHLLITDLEMPGIDGLELIKKVKKRDPDIRAIMITGNEIDDVAAWSLRYGIDNYMKKPFNIMKLKRVVKQTLCTHKIVLEKM